MIAEEYNNNQLPNLSLNKGKTINFIIEIIKEVPEYFILAITTSNIVGNLNEDKLTQIFIGQINSILHKKGIPITAQAQYYDIFFGATGITDWFFQTLEQGKTSPPLFVVESKRLPAPTTDREKEYVIGNNKNGGIERFKIEKHGKGYPQAGLLGFVEQETFEHWHKTINKWIENLANNNTFWNVDEKLKNIENQSNLSYLRSIAHRKKDDINLHHFWMKINNAR